jgi:acyl-CoA synthetase (AMP-forming)/AMP-acid ligase II
VDLLRQRAHEQPDDPAFIFLRDGDSPSDTVTWAQLDERSRAIAAALAQHASAGDRVLLAYPSGLEFIAGFFGALYAAAIAVPVQPPRSHRQSSVIARFDAIRSDARPAAVLTHSSMAALPLPARTTILATDTLPERLARSWSPPSIDPEAIAFLQYTSGSTSAPRGVMVSHDNVLHNLAAAFAMSTSGPVAASVSWLPFTHDMGLIEGLLQPILRGHRAVLLPPAAFLQRPARWLRAISTYRAARSGGPNFAYDLCARRVTDAEISALDLSCWHDAYNGAEPVRRETLTAFAARFAPTGFRADAFRPCYGLAEATLLVSCDRWRGDEAGGVSCGVPAPGTTIAVVDPVSRRRCDAGEIGELWVAGPGVARGYWGSRESTARTFGARLDGEFRDYLRTGDLGFIDDRGLHVTGRIKDVLIVRGQKHFPVDLEVTASEAHPAAMPFGAAAFSSGAGVEGDRIVMAIEIDRGAGRAHRPDEIVAAVRRAVIDNHGVLLDDVVLLPPRALPRTTSGKVQRYLCRDRWRLGRLQAGSEATNCAGHEPRSRRCSVAPARHRWVL